VKKLKILLIICLFIITGCGKNDNILFKEEYESLNNNSKYREVSIIDDNKMTYITDLELVDKINNKEDLVVYFGFNTCPWCRSVIENLIEVANDLEIDKIYYLDIKDIRDIKKIEDNNIIIEKEGTEGYNKLVNLLSDYLEDYIMEDKVVGKRIYAPNILVIKNKTIKGVITGISDMQINPNDELTNEIKEDSYNKIYNLLKEYNNNSCSSFGC